MIRIAQNKDSQLVDYKHWQSGITHREVMFTGPVHDWELESLQSIFDILYSHKIIGMSKIGCSGFYLLQILTNKSTPSYPWKSIQKAKAPTRVDFFTWTVAKGKILTLENLRKRNICVINRCCMCRNDQESVYHLLILCMYAYSLWNFVFCFFGVSQVLAKHVVLQLVCWQEGMVVTSKRLYGVPFLCACCGLLEVSRIVEPLRGMNILF